MILMLVVILRCDAHLLKFNRKEAIDRLKNTMKSCICKNQFCALIPKFARLKDVKDAMIRYL